MKEIQAIIRRNNLNQTKEALVNKGFNSLTWLKVRGRGKNEVDYKLANQDSTSDIKSTSTHRLTSKRLIILVVTDEKVDKAVKTIIEANQSGNPGDGKIFVLPLTDAFRVRTGETGETAI